jgi:hypothetical protein
MKKLCFLVAVFLVANLAFAQENVKTDSGIEKFSMEINVGFPVHWTNGVHDDAVNSGNMIEDKSVTANTAIGFATNFNFTRTFGLTLDMDFSFGAKLSGFATPASDHLSLAGANVFFGPVIYLYNSNSLRIPFAFGVHLYYFTDDLWLPDLGVNGAWINRQEFQLGPEVSLGIQFHFDNGIYVFCRTNVAVDMFRMHSMSGSNGTAYDENSHTDFSLNWSVKPCIGIGIKF